MRRKTARRRRTLDLLLIGLAILGSAWLLQNAGGAAAPRWLRSLLNPGAPLAGATIGLVAGHKGSDSGALCEDGLTEAEVNLRIAEATAARLRALGAQVDLMDEFDRRLAGFQAAAFVSIHADSCEVELSGFKVASPEEGDPASKRLEDCLWQQYEDSTGLPRHPGTITHDMTRYHAFREIAPTTPAAIIEVGFLGGDRPFLTENPDRAAAGISAGIICLLAPDQ